MLWKTKTDGAYRCVRLIDGVAIKTPYLFKFEDLAFLWEKDGRPKSIRWLKNWWWELFRTGCKHNEQEARQWGKLGAQEINGVRLCRVRRCLPWGLAVVMDKAEPLGRPVRFPEEDFAARTLIGRAQDLNKESTFGIVAGNVVIVDYGWWVPPPSE
jgi:hypothetical protein